MSEFKSDSSVKRIMKNGMFTALRFGVYTLSGILFIPFLVKQYGAGTYGLIALAGFLTQYVGLVSGCVGRSVARFLNIALNKNDWKQANEIFNTAIVANLGIICIQLPLFALGVWKLDWLIDFPPEIASDFRILVICNIALFFLNIMKGVFFTPIQAANRLDISEKFDIAGQLIRLVLLFSLISGIGPKLWIIGVVDLAISLLIFAVGLLVYRKLVHRNLVFEKKYITMKWVMPVLNMAGWTLVSALGFALFVKTDVWIINRFVSKEMAGIYAALLVWPNFVKQIGGQLSSLIGPVYMIDYARADYSRMIKICLFLNKVLGLCAAVAVGFIFIFSEDILRIWLGAEFIQYSLLLKLMAGGLILTLGEAVVWGIFPAINKTHYTGVANLATGVLNIVLSLGLVYAGFGVYGVAVGTLVSTILKCAVWIPYSMSRELKFPYGRFLLNNAIALILFGIILGVNSGFRLLLPHVPMASLISFFGSILFAAPLAFFYGFTPAERLFVQSKIIR